MSIAYSPVTHLGTSFVDTMNYERKNDTNFLQTIIWDSLVAAGLSKGAGDQPGFRRLKVATYNNY